MKQNTPTEVKEMTNKAMEEIKKQIVAAFKKQYGFAPTMKAIRPLECSGTADKIDYLAFHISGHGYDYANGIVEANEVYDF